MNSLAQEKGSEKTRKDLKFTLKPDLRQRNSLQQFKKEQTKNQNNNQQPWRRQRISTRVTTLLDSNVKFSTTTKSQGKQRNGEVWAIEGKK